VWLPSRSADLDAADEREVTGLRRDTTTLVMQARIPDRPARHDGVARTSIAAATRVTDEPVPALELGDPETVPGLAAWTLVHDGMAVAGAWSYLHDDDCGIYAVGTSPAWQRRGLGRTLVEHVLADARSRGARTATLQSTRVGQRLYESVGFAPVGRYEEWIVDGAIAPRNPGAVVVGDTGIEPVTPAV
jgi:ribosomal protein S18 acetylase RimI-like enzyme